MQLATVPVRDGRIQPAASPPRRDDRTCHEFAWQVLQRPSIVMAVALAIVSRIYWHSSARVGASLE
ncbi:MAG TPA: hypothetical protein VEL79_02780 [Vicinamibacterales bacterium]|nr:hypothetical protein [Vicinamibacterales bacterium]